MNNKGLEFIEKNIVDILKKSQRVDINTILDYLDYKNKVRYSKVIIKTILDKLVSEEKIVLEGTSYYLKRIT